MSDDTPDSKTMLRVVRKRLEEIEAAMENADLEPYAADSLSKLYASAKDDKYAARSKLVTAVKQTLAHQHTMRLRWAAQRELQGDAYPDELAILKEAAPAKARDAREWAAEQATGHQVPPLRDMPVINHAEVLRGYFGWLSPTYARQVHDVPGEDLDALVQAWIDARQRVSPGPKTKYDWFNTVLESMGLPTATEKRFRETIEPDAERWITLFRGASKAK